MISIEEDQAIQATSEIQKSTKASNDDVWRKIDLTRTESNLGNKTSTIKSIVLLWFFSWQFPSEGRC